MPPSTKKVAPARHERADRQAKHSHPSAATAAAAADFIDQHHPEKPSARAQTAPPRRWTATVAIPGSIVLNAQTMELRAWLVGQIARTCAIFSVSEIVVYRDAEQTPTVFKPRGKYRDPAPDDKDEEDPATFLCRILEYLETPQYLRKALFPLHPSLRLAGLLPPLDCPHHLRRDDLSPFREGVVVAKGGQGKQAREGVVTVDIGQWETIEAEDGGACELSTRVTVRMPESASDVPRIVPPSTPTSEAGLYWGYSVRLADSLAAVFSESPYVAEGGYDVSIGTSERGTPVEDILGSVEPFRHMLLALGPLSGLEITIAGDPLIPLQAEEASDLFDHWINVVEGQGSRTVRTEEALPIALARLKTTLEAQGTAGTA